MSNNSIKISLILPCYNIEKYIADCLDSIYNQDVDECEYEVICVNDCSPDKTKEIIQNFKKDHSNITLIDHEINKRVGAARNSGFNISKGKYIWFIDPDDIIKKECLSELINILEKKQLDILQFCHQWMDEKKNQIYKTPYDHNFYQTTDCMSGIDFIELNRSLGIPYSNMHVGCFVRIYSRDFLLKNNIIFPEVAYYEDQYHALNSLVHAQNFMNLNKAFYLYRVVPNSYSHKPMSIEKRAGQLMMCCDIYCLLKTHSIDKDMSSYVWKRYHADYQYCYTNFILLLNNKDRIFFIRNIESRLGIVKEILYPQKKFMCNHPKLFIYFTSILRPLLVFMKKIKNKLQ